jgi:predicted metal-dependent HD superfamily phosphohydrolase
MMDFTAARDFIIDKLRTGLRPELLYHSIEHTLDVYESSLRLAKAEGLDAHTLSLLKTAALIHDAGMLKTYQGHEEASIELAELWLPHYGYASADIDSIARMIMATKLPQFATMPAERILCDADLDYLGRDDFFLISHRLRLEWMRLNVRQTSLREWYRFQIEFLEGHNYFCLTARNTRQQGKEENIRLIREICQ